MKTKIILAAMLAATLGVTGCATHTGPKENAGMIVGGLLGGVLGHQVGGGKGRTAATALGTLIGASIGGSVGRSMDDMDRMKVGATLETTRTGVTSRWENPDTGHEYAVTPTKTYETAKGPCREYTMDAVIGGKTEQVYGTACRQPDGSWKIAD